MTPHLQTLYALALVAAALVLLVRRAGGRSAGAGCGGCPGCPAAAFKTRCLQGASPRNRPAKMPAAQ